jgi:hypothetical protein
LQQGWASAGTTAPAHFDTSNTASLQRILWNPWQFSDTLAAFTGGTMDPQQQQAQVMHLMAVMLPMMLLIWAVFIAFFTYAFWRIFTKAGMAGPLSLLILVPGIGPLIVICILAFGTWKVVPAPPDYGAYPPSYPPPPANYPPQDPTA